jgi:hypothetical protein
VTLQMRTGRGLLGGDVIGQPALDELASPR